MDEEALRRLDEAETRAEEVANQLPEGPVPLDWGLEPEAVNPAEAEKRAKRQRREDAADERARQVYQERLRREPFFQTQRRPRPRRRLDAEWEVLPGGGKLEPAEDFGEPAEVYEARRRSGVVGEGIPYTGWPGFHR